MFIASKLLIMFYPLILLIDINRGYFVLQWLIIILFSAFYICILVLLLIEIEPAMSALDMIRAGENSINLSIRSNTVRSMKETVNWYYGTVQLTKYIQQCLILRFGNDIALIIVEYAFDAWMVKK